jgi:hypothetical protein
MLLFKILWYVLCAPGYIILWLGFYFPTETGKGRNVAQSGRSWRNRKVLAPIYTIGFYIVVFLMFKPEV